MKNALKTAFVAIVIAATVIACGTKSETTAEQDTTKVEAIDTTVVATDTTAAVVPADTTAVAK